MRSRDVSARVAAVALAAALAGAAAFVGGSPAQAVQPGDWTMFAHDDAHSGNSGDTTITASATPSLGLGWMTNLGSATFTSPIVVSDLIPGKQLVFMGSRTGAMAAYDAANGERVWIYNTKGAIASTPAFAGGYLYFGSADNYLYALNATTGALACRVNVGGVINASPVVANLGGTGRVVWVGDNGFGGHSDGGHFWAINAVDPNAAPDCSVKWMFDSFGEPAGSQPLAGSWSPPSLARNIDGRTLVVFGGSSPDNAGYALDAETGQRVWRFQTVFPFPDADVGAGQAISAPGVNGFADGVVYLIGKGHVMYAINLRTGAKIWEYNIENDVPPNGGTRSTPALVGDRVYVGFYGGVYAFNAITGAKVWRYDNPAKIEVISSPAIAGPTGNQVLFVGDLTGRFSALRLSDGKEIWHYQTGSFIYGSAAVANGKVYVGSADGYLYQFGLGGGVSAKPTVQVQVPADNATIPYPPSGVMPISGTASDDTAVSKVLVSVRNTTGNTYWNGSRWVKNFATLPATLGTPGGTTTTWSSSVPVSDKGMRLVIQVEAVDPDGQHTAPVSLTKVTVQTTGNPPETTITSPKRKDLFHLPTPMAEFPITVRGTATDTAGANPGVQKVIVVVKNNEHTEYYCGFVGCAFVPGAPGGESESWAPTYKTVEATLANPGATSTTWSVTFPAYDHPHTYRVSAWAIDKDGEVDVTKAEVNPVCVRAAGAPSCY